ncbi:MAG: S16 family serine protease [Candidatus Micrarchaeia archaeon]
MKFFLLLSVFLIANVSVYAYTSIHAPAVVLNESTGSLTVISLNLSRGDGAVTIAGPSSVGFSTLASAKEAVSFACSFTGANESAYNFSFTIHDKNVSVSGPSAGAAFTLLTISALENKPLVSNFTISGTIESNGSIGLIGGVYDKAEAAAKGHMRFFLLPNAGEGGSMEELLYYISQDVFNVPIQQVSNISQALKFAFGNAQAVPFQLNLTQHYAVANLPPFTCNSCNTSTSLFAKLANFTLNFTSQEISKIPSTFSSAKQQMLANQQRYYEIEKKGYLYTAADFAFLQFLQAFVLANKANYSYNGTYAVLSNISNYCSSLLPPIPTNKNYEYVIGGEMRQELANVTLTQAMQLLNSSEATSDTYIESLYYGAEALAWCKASQELYNLSSTTGGNFVTFSPVLQGQAAKEIQKAESFGDNLYLESAIKSYDSGSYAPALYLAVYADVIGNPSLGANMSKSEMINATLSNINSSLYGVWPLQFAAEGRFYLYEYEHGLANLSTAYRTSVLAQELGKANRILEAAFIVSNATAAVPQLVESEISSINNEIQQVLALLIAIFVLLLAILIMLIVQLANSKKERTAGKMRKASRRSR